MGLHHDVGGDFGGTEEAVLALVDGEVLGDAVLIRGVGVVPAAVEFFERDGVGSVAIDLVRAHMNERRVGCVTARGFEEIQGANGVRIEVLEWP